MEISNLNLNSELLEGNDISGSDELREQVYHVVIDKSIGDYFLELIFFILRCIIVCFVPIVIYYFFVLFTGFNPSSLL